MATTYITNSEAAIYLGYSITDNIINKAEQDLDDIALGAYTKSQIAPFRKLTISELTPTKADSIKRATAEQIKYRNLMGETFFVKPQRKAGSAEGISFSGALPHVGPRVLAILADAGLIKRLGSYNSSNKIDIEDVGF